MSRTDLLLRAADLRAARTPFVLATVVRAQRPTSAKAGDSALVLPDGTIDGFVGGTCAESTVRSQGLRLLATGSSTLLRITPEPAGGDDAAGEGLVTVANPCLSGGALEIFLEAMMPPRLVWVLGDGPVARAMVRVGEAIGYAVRTSTDPDAPLPADAEAVVVATHGRDEERVLETALRAAVPYVALVASRRRAGAVLGGLDVPMEQRDRVRAPAGLDLGARTAAEVALAILAEIIASRPPADVPAGTAAVPPGAGAPVDFPADSAESAESAEPEVAGHDDVAGTTVAGLATTDPVCGMTVRVGPHTLRLTHAGRDWYFCGAGCRAAFAHAPTQHLADG